MILADFRLPTRLRGTAAQLALVACPDDLDSLGIVDSLVDHFEMQLRTLPRFVRQGMLAGMLTFELGPAAVPGFGRVFSRLDRDKARRWFVSWWKSPIGLFHQLVKGVKALLVFAYYEHPSVRKRLEYHPDRWIAEAARRRLASYGAEIERHEEMLTQPDPLIRPAALARKVRHA